MDRVLRNIFLICLAFLVIALLGLGIPGVLNINIMLGGLTSIVLMFILILVMKPKINKKS